MFFGQLAYIYTLSKRRKL